jgi:hypothetical protein
MHIAALKFLNGTTLRRPEEIVVASILFPKTRIEFQARATSVCCCRPVSELRRMPMDGGGRTRVARARRRTISTGVEICTDSFRDHPDAAELGGGSQMVAPANSLMALKPAK